MHVRHRNATHHRANDPHKPLVGAAQEQVVQVGFAVEHFIRGPIDRAVVVPSKATDRGWRK